MADSNEEKGLLGPPLKPHPRYGSTSVNMKKPDHTVVHFVTKGDTIQGIALKYGVSVELVKQHNRLWSSKSMFLHDFLEVPVSRLMYQSIVKNDPSAAHIPVIDSSKPSPCSQESDESSESGKSSPTLNKNKGVVQSPSSPNGLHDCSEKSSSDILSKIDSNIAIMKSNIEKMESFSYPMVDQMEVDDSCHKNNKHHSNAVPNGWSENRYQNNSTSWQDPTLPPRTIINNPSRTITMSLKRLLKEHEEIYEL